jgi:hypothetical protein
MAQLKELFPETDGVKNVYVLVSLDGLSLDSFKPVGDTSQSIVPMYGVVSWIS